jgi:hypothetical protein
MFDEFTIQRNGRYLHVILPDLEIDWTGVWRAVEFELEEGIELVEVIAPSYEDEESLDGVRELVSKFEEQGMDAIVEWQGVPVLAGAVP